MEIRRSVMGRPNLSERTIAFALGPSRVLSTLAKRYMPSANCLWSKPYTGFSKLWKGDTQAGQFRQPFPFQWHPVKPGGAGVSTCTLGAAFLRELERKPLLAAAAR